MPDLDRLHRTYRDQGLAVIALSDETPERLQKFFDDIPVELVAAYTEQYNWLLIDTFRPLTLVIDRDGVLRRRARVHEPDRFGALCQQSRFGQFRLSGGIQYFGKVQA